MTRLTDWLQTAAARLRPPAAPMATIGASNVTPRPPQTQVATAASCVRGPERLYPFDQRLERLYFAHSTAWLDRVALIDSPAPGVRRELSHRELGHRVLVLAHRLRAAGVQPQQTVAAHVERTSELVVVILATWLVGAVYLPLDRAFPPAYLASLCEIARPSLVLTHGGEAAELVAAGVPRLDLASIDFDAAAAAGGAGLEPFAQVSPDAPSLVMFTSGSTGQPKGVVHSQRQLINRLHWMWEDYPYEPGDVQGQRSPMNVMPSMWELLGGVLAGVPTALAPDRVLREPSALFAWFADQGVSQLTLTPPLIKLLLDLKRRGAQHPSRLRRVINGGPMSAALQERFHAELSGVKLLHDFGCTETNTYLHDARPIVPGAADGMGGYRPIANTTIHLLDEQGAPVAPGVEGEVYIHGPSLALGYLGRPELSAERFIAGGPPGCRVEGHLFRTGEMAVLQPNGTLRMTGRFDHQAKVNGLRVELEHVELVLGDHPAVSECAVVAHATSELHTRLTAFWVAREGQPANAAVLQQFLAERLPAHMVPGHFQLQSALPRRPNGKVDRMLLKQQAVDTAPQVAVVTAPIIGVPLLREVAAGVLGVAVDRIDPQVEFANQGFDSALLMSFAEAVSARTGIELQVASCFDHPSIELLARHLGPGQLAAGHRVPAAPVLPASQDGIAIIGISLRVPGAADRDAFWRNLEGGVESVGEIPPERWNAEAWYDADISTPGKSNSKWGGFLRDVDQFEPLFFHLSPKDAAAMDPQQRLCLMESWRALEDAGYAPDSLAGRPVGVYIGAREPEYPVLAARQGQQANAGLMLGGDMSLIAARLSYFLNIDGPSVVVDTACSSSMTALHLACTGLRQGDAEIALVGGVCLTLDPSFYVASSKLGIFSPTGHCRAFDAAADGFVHGEGVAFVVLKPLAAAQRDGDSVYAVIRGTAMNQDGRSNGITAPNGLAQTRLQTGLYRKLGIDPASIGYVEAHGTGTALGDVVELQALVRSFESAPLAPRSVAIGSVKPNVGHLTAASGLVGVIKAALCVHHGRLVPSINYREPNPKIDFDRTPFYVNTVARPWPAPAGDVRRAAINSFGIGGTNGHCVIEGLVQRDAAPQERTRWLLAPVSARTERALDARLRQLRDWIDENHDVALHTVAFTLACGRSRFAHGHVFAFRDRQQFRAQLDAAIAGRSHDGVWPLAPIEQRRAIDPSALAEGARRWRLALDAEPDQQAVEHLGRLIAAGFEPRWEEWFARDERRRTALPAYPFDTESCWLLRRDVAAPTQAVPAPTAVAPQPDRASAAAIAAVLATVRTVLAQELGMDPAAIDPDAALSSYGMESVKAINLRFVFEAQLGVDLSVQDIVGADTARDLAVLAHTLSARSIAACTAGDDDALPADIEHASDAELIKLFQQLSTSTESNLSHAS
ncbi:beta-ketoacyl synthase N-terminal-like domain-containing protein [Ideonella sp. DXS29W]|uniref:Beta-ketoacyl synthase N-terminal-like domain-containing protein n=1 Tax=Ideonella lacteola TaxID=2984193 RepID=A0ABU9BXN9_9BURK